MTAYWEKNIMDRNCKTLAVFGDESCGKTSLFLVLTNDVFPEEYIPKVFDVAVTEINVDNEDVRNETSSFLVLVIK